MENIQYPTQKETQLISQAMSGKKVNFRTEKVSCEFCEKRVKPRGLKQHQTKSIDCRIEQCDLFIHYCGMDDVKNVKFIRENNYDMLIIHNFLEGFIFAAKNECLDTLKYLWDADDNLNLWDDFDAHLTFAYENSTPEIVKWMVSLFPDDYQLDENGKPTKIFRLPLKKEDCIICYENKTCYQVNCCKKTFCHDCLTNMATDKCAHCRQKIV
jgi:hypothetical protein